MPRRYLLPIDGSDNCKHAARFYLENLKQDDDVLLFVHVIEPSYSSPAVSLTKDNAHAMVGAMTKSMQESMEAGKLLGQRYMSWAKEHDLQSKAFVHVDPKPGVAILKAAEERQADHIIIGSRGLNALGRSLLGSVSNYIVHHSTIPVTVVPSKPEERAEVKGVRRFSLY
ncbi:unnamed protein product [Schistocephalus solidus]|uniref:Universal stress protein MJ0531 n=1 Tax=Schistocephalus solidus TaxID=70667 RepID=A0A0X3NTJ1_SCHSO|nr:unnamed protein product [Schistocephalus solidus]